MRHTNALTLGLETGRRIVGGGDFEQEFVDDVHSYFRADAGAGLTRLRLRPDPGTPGDVSVTVSGCAPLSRTYLDAAWEVVPRHPGFPAMARAGTRQPVRLSDVVRLPRFWGTEVFHRMHGHVPRARYPMSALLACSGTEMVFIALHRSDHDFSDADVRDLAAVQEVVSAAWRYRDVRAAAIRRAEDPGSLSAAPVPPPARATPVTAREAQVLDLLVLGYSNAQIGARLGITERTVRKHLGAVYDGAGLAGRAAASAWWQRHRARQRPWA